jgi:hypothetical protein
VSHSTVLALIFNVLPAPRGQARASACNGFSLNPSHDSSCSPALGLPHTSSHDVYQESQNPLSDKEVFS